ncbi:hypothetical protein [Brucella sp. 10RB9213]|uniref:hypothetical protein n=1 Tax=Brucella sp. 10RB9213 TaxID=1844039 RepID=UPI0012AD44BE|nr:hypothetical protein [Brucella sp. 10RB9213]MRN66398.1 hypothetical protein [Brucella sp. 10RB9213]
MCKPKVPKTPTPAQAPPPAAESAAVAQGDVVRDEGDNENAVQRSRRKGRNSLRIKLDAGNTGGSSGLNIPQA